MSGSRARTEAFAFVAMLACGEPEDRAPSTLGSEERCAACASPRPSATATDSAPRDPCARVETVAIDGGQLSYSAPCRPYDVRRDLGRPTP